MNKILRKLYQTLVFYGFDAKRLLKALKTERTGWFYKDLEELKRQKGADTTFKLDPRSPILTEKNEEGGEMRGQYFHQDLYVARQIYLAKPQKHLDIGSRTDGFVAHVACFREIELIDIRIIKSAVKNIDYRQADMMEELPGNMINYCDSVSSLHAIEHFGLGRYGDPINYFGYLKAIDNITLILRSGGNFYFSVPIGPQRIEFNAHRVFSVEYLITILSPTFTINSFSYVDDSGNFFENVELLTANVKSDFGCYFGCGIFILTKK